MTQSNHPQTTQQPPKSNSRGATGPLVVSESNPRYFTTRSGKETNPEAIYLTGSHINNNFHDGMGPGADCPETLEQFDYDMGKVVTNLSMSLDGFVAGPNDDVQQVFAWTMRGDSAIPVQGGRMVLKISPQSAELIEEALRTTGAMVAGRRMFDLAKAWGGNPPHAPCFIVTHSPPQEWVKEGSPFTFVTDGVESAIRQAKQAAKDKHVAVATASITQQCLKAGLLDEIHIDLVPVLLGAGIRLFEHLGAEPIELERIRVIEAPGVTHLGFRIVK